MILHERSVRTTEPDLTITSLAEPGEPNSRRGLSVILMRALGLDHRKLTYPHEGRADSLTDHEVTKAKVVPQSLV